MANASVPDSSHASPNAGSLASRSEHRADDPRQTQSRRPCRATKCLERTGPAPGLLQRSQTRTQGLERCARAHLRRFEFPDVGSLSRTGHSWLDGSSKQRLTIFLAICGAAEPSAQDGCVLPQLPFFGFLDDDAVFNQLLRPVLPLPSCWFAGFCFCQARVVPPSSASAMNGFDPLLSTLSPAVNNAHVIVAEDDSAFANAGSSSSYNEHGGFVSRHTVTFFAAGSDSPQTRTSIEVALSHWWPTQDSPARAGHQNRRGGGRVRESL